MYRRRERDSECCATEQDEVERAAEEADRISHPVHIRTAAIDTVAGMAAGAVAGVVAGPPGILAGLVLGGAAGAAAGMVVEGEEKERAEHENELDTDIGVYGGRIGETQPNPPPPETGALMGASTPSAESGEGPIENADWWPLEASE